MKNLEFWMTHAKNYANIRKVNGKLFFPGRMNVSLKL